MVEVNDGGSRVRGLLIPALLVKAIESGEWRQNHDLGRLRHLFGEDPDSPGFYSLQGMAEQTDGLLALEEDLLSWYLGDPASSVRPGDLRADSFVLIGDLGPERPFALDYRNSHEDPEIVYMTESGAWRVVASGVAEFLQALGIRVSDDGDH